MYLYIKFFIENNIYGYKVDFYRWKFGIIKIWRILVYKGYYYILFWNKRIKIIKYIISLYMMRGNKYIFLYI